ncbi:hypothetical protein VNO77_09561 [Canavalia gladiata]|uniref:Uncharacterized protein n=1 Tax=Canavalia gladiata TaxID=3824 RepID=A0AAN9QWM5_CANGL
MEKHIMVSKLEEAEKRNRRVQKPQQQWQKQIQCNKGKVCKFKRSSFNLEDDGASSAILLLACIALFSFLPTTACPD